jgi:hypothetical protein
MNKSDTTFQPLEIERVKMKPILPESLLTRFQHFQKEFDAAAAEKAAAEKAAAEKAGLPAPVVADYYLNSFKGAGEFGCRNYKSMVEELYTEWNTSENPEIAKQLFALIFVFYYRTRDRTNYGTTENPKYFEECVNIKCGNNNKLISLTTYTINGVCNWMIPDRNWQPFITSFNVISEMQGENRDKFTSYFNEANSLMPEQLFIYGKNDFYRKDKQKKFIKFPDAQTANQIYGLLTTPCIGDTKDGMQNSYNDFLKIVAQQRAECKRGKGVEANIAAFVNKFNMPPRKGGSKRKTRRRQKKRKTKRRKTRR